jgi:hypothetical protein
MTALIDLFVLAYLVVAVFWHLPGWRLWRMGLEPLAPVIRGLGFDQYWGMFAPDPATSDRDLVVILERRSGAALSWEPPRLHTLSRWDAFLAFRYRSYEHDILYGDDLPACRAALAEYLLRKYDFGADTPRAVVFSYVDRSIAPPGQEDPEPTTRAVFFTHDPSETVL